MTSSRFDHHDDHGSEVLQFETRRSRAHPLRNAPEGPARRASDADVSSAIMMIERAAHAIEALEHDLQTHHAEIASLEHENAELKHQKTKLYDEFAAMEQRMRVLADRAEKAEARNRELEQSERSASDHLHRVMQTIEASLAGRRGQAIV